MYCVTNFFLGHMYYRSNDKIGDYTVVFPIKQGYASETYRVRSADGRRYFCKVIDPSMLRPDQIDSDGNVCEIAILRQLDHEQLPHVSDTFIVSAAGRRLEVMIQEFISSETVSDRLQRAQTLSVYDTKEIALGVLSALRYMHGQSDPVIHNEITALNVIIDLSSKNPRAVKLIDFGSARYLKDAMQQQIDGLNWFYLAPERFDGVSTPQSDLYSVGALIYQMLFGTLPWFCDLSTISPDKRKQYLLKQKSTALLMPVTDKFELDENLLNVMRKALAFEIDDRFESAQQFIDALNGRIRVEPPAQSPSTPADRKDAFSAYSDTPKGNGFADVAGMDELKSMLQKSVLNILRDTEKAKRYKLQIPNGILFYGPPGCGKSFMAEKFAEEAGYNFKFVKSSDLASIYVHGSQEKIGQLFEEARKNAPAILCFDEFDALVPARGKTGTEHQAGEVNEFLTQLNNCGEAGVFVIATTNRPDMIDQAVLRRGRIDKMVYIPMPDIDSRAAMFELHMQGRPYDSTIDFRKLASLTENFVASDIAYVVNEAATRAAFDDVKISQTHLEEAIASCQPSLSPAVIADYSRMRRKIEGAAEQRRRVGF